MIIRRKSPHTGKINEMDLPVTAEQMRLFEDGELIQKAFPDLTAEQREFILTGYTQEDWNEIFPPEGSGEEDEED